MPLHVSSNKCSSSGGPTCVSTSSGITHSGGSLFDVPVRRKLLTGTSDSHPPECVIPDEVLTQVGPPDDEHLLLETCKGMKQMH
jgi:hypothetical protein